APGISIGSNALIAAITARNLLRNDRRISEPFTARLRSAVAHGVSRPGSSTFKYHPSFTLPLLLSKRDHLHDQSRRPVEDKQDRGLFQNIVFVLSARSDVAEAAGSKYLALEKDFAFQHVFGAVCGVAVPLNVMACRESNHIDPGPVLGVLAQELVLDAFDLLNFIRNLSDTGILLRAIHGLEFDLVGIDNVFHLNAPSTCFFEVHLPRG